MVTLTLSGRDVAQLRRVIPAASTDDARPVLCGVHIADGVAAATDSYRLHVAELDLTADLPPMLLDAKALRKALGTSVKAARDGLTVNVPPPHSPHGEVGPGFFPKWRQLVPAETSAVHQLTVDRLELLHAARRALVFTEPRGRFTVPMALRSDSAGRAWVTARAEGGTFAEWMPAEGSVPGGLEGTGFNPAYLVGVLEAATGVRVTLCFRDELKPMVVRDDGALLLLMSARGPGSVELPAAGPYVVHDETPVRPARKAFRLPTPAKLLSAKHYTGSGWERNVTAYRNERHERLGCDCPVEKVSHQWRPGFYWRSDCRAAVRRAEATVEAALSGAVAS